MKQTRTRKTARSLLVWLLLFTMVFGLLPMAAFADEAESGVVDVDAPEATDEPVVTEQPEEPQQPEEPETTEQPADADADEADESDEADTQAAEVINYVEKVQNVPLRDAGDMGYRIVHIDCGRKYFSLTDLKKIVDYAYEYGYTHVELAFGNDALRFLLDDMSLTVGGNSYDSNTVKSAIQSGNAAFYASGELSQGEMDAIISYANDKGIGIIPMFDAPGHMQAVVSAMKTLGLTPKYSTPTESGKSLNYAIDTTDALSVNFVQALVQKYITYFAGKGCTMFNIAADECGFIGMTTEQYTAYAKFVNSMAAMVQNAGMTALAFNDGIYHKGLTTDTAFDTNIAICYWDASTDKYSPASTLAGYGFKIINTHNKWYYVVGNEGNEWYGYSWAQGYLNGECKDCRQTDGGYTTNVGCMIAIWCDNPGANVNWSNVENHIKTLSKNNSSYFKKAELPATPALTADKTNVKVGETVSLSIENYTGDVEWSSSAPEVLSVEANGASATATAFAVGSATITASADGNNYTVDIKVTSADVIDVENEVTVTLEVGATEKVIVADADYTDSVNKTELDETVAGAEVTSSYTEAENITYNAKATASISAYKEGYTTYSPNNLIDGNTSTKYWSNSAQTVGAWVQVDIGAEIPFDAVRLTSAGNSGDICKNANVLVSADGKAWTNIGSYTGSTKATVFNNTLTKVRYIKVEITTPKNNWWQLSEIEWGNINNDIFTRMPASGTVSIEGNISTNITFTGVAVGTTYVVIGNTRYTINVVPVDLSKVTALPIQLWITNNTIEASGENAKNSGSGWGGDSSFGYARYIEIPSAAGNADSLVYSEEGMSVSDAFAAAGMTEPLVRYEWGGTRLVTAKDDKPAQNLVFWTGRIHNSSDSNIQNVWGADYSNSGAAFNYVRYWGGAWQVSADREAWTTVTGEGSTGTYNSCKQQLAAYFMTRTKITEEIITDVADWGKPKGGTEYTSQVNEDFVLLDYAVKYEDGIRVPTNFPVKDKTLAYHCADNNAAVGTDSSKNKYRMLNNFRGVETEDFEVYMVTVTMTADSANTTLTASKAEAGYTYDGTEQIVWAIDQEAHDKSGLSDYASISGSTTYSGCTIGGDPYIRGVEVYNKHGALITYYIRAKKTVEYQLTVNYYVEGESTPFYSYNIAVDEKTTFNPGFARTENPLGLINNKVINIRNVEQVVNWKLEEMPQINAQYRYVDYQFIRTDFTGEDYKIVNLYYTFSAEKTFVVDFGLPLVIEPSDINENLTATGVSLTDVEVGNISSFAKITKDNACNVTYTLTSMIDGSDNFSLQYSGTLKIGEQEKPQSGQTAKYTVTIIPASNVYYEDSFATFVGGKNTASAAQWSVEGTETSANQALEQLGGEKNNVYGYDPAYADSTMFSMGSAHTVKVTSDMLNGWNDDSAWPTASFTFKGTGFDVISLTDNRSGGIFVDVYNTKTNALEKSYIVNNYYGYTYDDSTKEWVVSANGENALYQIPVMKVSGLPYGEYKAVITVFYDSFTDTASKGGYSFWLDAIRVYNPLGENYSDYTKDGEGYPQYIKLHDYVVTGKVSVNDKLLFIDGAASADVATYANFGPNNEVYLASGQAISFKLSGNLDKIAEVQIGAKAPNGETNLNVNGANTVEMLKTATEMYYDITAAAKNGGTVTVTNNGANILSLTNIKVTFAESASVELAVPSETDKSEAVALVRALFAAPVAEPDPFEPSRFEAKWSDNVRQGGRAVLTVKTSEDVEQIVINGDVVVDSYRTRTERSGWGWNAKRVTYREFTYMITAQEGAEYSVTAVNADGVESEAITATLTVKPARPSWGWFDSLFGRWF